MAGVCVETDDAESPNESVSVPRKNEVTATSRYRGGWLDGFMAVSCLTESLLRASYTFRFVSDLVRLHSTLRISGVWLGGFHFGFEADTP